MDQLTGRQKTVGALLVGYLLAVFVDPFVTVVRLNVENWATENGFGAVYNWPIVSRLGQLVMSLWDALTGSWGFGVICGMVILTIWETLKRPRQARQEVLSRPIVATPAVAALPAFRPQARQRDYVDERLTPEKMLSASEGKSSLESRVLFKQFEGKWLKINALFGEISADEDGGMCVTAGIPAAEKGKFGIHLICFLNEANEEIFLFNKGSQIMVDGRIIMMSAHSICLADCVFSPKLSGDSQPEIGGPDSL